MLPLGFHGPFCMHCSAAVLCFSLLAAASGASAAAAAGLVAPCWKFGPLQLHASTNGASEASERSERAKLSDASSGFPRPIVHALLCCYLVLVSQILCLLLLLWVFLLLLLVSLPLVGNFGPLQVHASTTFNNVRASRSFLRQVHFSLNFGSDPATGKKQLILKGFCIENRILFRFPGVSDPAGDV